MVERNLRLVAGLVPGEQPHRGVELLVMDQRKQRDPHRRVGIRDTGGRRVVAGEDPVPDANP